MLDNFSVVVGEVDKAVFIMREVAEWAHSIGFDVWRDEDLMKDALMKYAREDEFCIGRIDDTTDACCMILQWYDPLFWPGAKENEAGYIHKLCVRRNFAGIGLSRKMVEYAAMECKKKGIRYLRLDTLWKSKKLCKLYKNLGFQIVDKIELGNNSFALFEMRVN